MKTTILSKDGTREIDLNRRRAIRERCVNCSGWNFAEVERCSHTDCDLYPYRMGKMEKGGSVERERALRAYCVWCMAGQINEVRLCPSALCPLHLFRLPSSAKAMKGPSLPENHRGDGGRRDDLHKPIGRYALTRINHKRAPYMHVGAA